MRERVGEIVSGLEVNLPDFDPEDLTETRLSSGSRTTTSPPRLPRVRPDPLNGEDALCAVEDSGLGILRQTEGGAVSHSFAELPPEVRGSCPRAQAPEFDQGQLAGHGAQALSTWTTSASKSSTSRARSRGSAGSSGYTPLQPTAPASSTYR